VPQTLPEPAKAWLDAQEFITLATIEPDGRPQQSVVWVTHDGDDVLMSTVKGRRKQRNLERDSRATALLFPKENPYNYLEVRGNVSMTEEGGRELIDELHEKYHGSRPYPYDGPGDVRVVIRLSPEHVVFHGPA
jgi:PPOX class probable F420-dependent enzyme